MNQSLRLELKSRFDRFQYELWTPFHSDQPKYLHHFSPPSGACRIIKSKELWVSDILRLNDKREGTYMLNVFGPLLQRKFVPDSVKTRLRDADNLFRMGESWFAYVASFCATQNVDNQWEKYADHGTGCAIAIDLEALFATSNGGREFALLRLLYDEEEQRTKAEAAIDHAIRLSREMGIPKRELDHFWIAATLDSFLPCGLHFKDRQYEAEQEWRALMLRPDRSTARQRALSDGSEAYYMRLPLDASILRSVLRGPNCTCAIESIHNLLQASSFLEALEWPVSK